MTRRNANIVSAIVVAMMLALSAYAWTVLPADARIPTHFGLNGNANAYGGKLQALLLVPLLTAGIAAVLYYLPYVIGAVGIVVVCTIYSYVVWRDDPKRVARSA
jgi:uncharacterized membrane protein